MRQRSQGTDLPAMPEESSIHWHRVVVAVALALACGSSHAAELLSRLFSDHMVLQREMPVPVWGWADPRESVSVSIDGRTKVTQASETGKWALQLDPMQPGAPRKMIVKGKSETIEVSDILVGEVWIASGQSNMAWPLKQALNGQQEVAEADYPEIRLFNVPNAMAPKTPSERLPADNPKVANMNVWLPASPATAGEFSAVAYFFARDLHRSLNVPIGIIANAVGGSPIEAWISHDAYMADPDFKAVAQYYDGLANYVENTAAGKKEFADLSAQYDARQAQLRAAGKPLLWPPKYPGPLEWWGFGSTLYNALVHPLVPYAMRGVIWYQGEAQWQRMADYRAIFPLLIKDWRSRWGEGNFPFIYVQLPNWSQPKPDPDAGGWAMLREAQLLTLQVPRTAMAVTIELGDAASVHPLNKQDVGHRLGLAARGAVYDEKVVYSGPIYRMMKIEGNAIRVFFDHVGGGLMVGRKNAREPAMEDKGEKLKRFSIAGDDMKFVWADATIGADSVMVSSPSVNKPVAVRYAWENNPEGCNLYNRAGLTASPFRTDETKPSPMAAFFKARIQKGFTLQPDQ